MNSKALEIGKKMLAELDDMVSFYSENPMGLRAKERGSCTYKASNGNKCAIGRMLSEDDLRELEKEGNLEDTSIDSIIGDLTSKRVLDLPMSFLEALQALHDEDENWIADGLSAAGIKARDRIKENIYDERYK